LTGKAVSDPNMEGHVRKDGDVLLDEGGLDPKAVVHEEFPLLRFGSSIGRPRGKPEGELGAPSTSSPFVLAAFFIVLVTGLNGEHVKVSGLESEFPAQSVPVATSLAGLSITEPSTEMDAVMGEAMIVIPQVAAPFPAALVLELERSADAEVQTGMVRRDENVPANGQGRGVEKESCLATEFRTVLDPLGEKGNGEDKKEKEEVAAHQQVE
jgi:hypothetical protein